MKKLTAIISIMISMSLLAACSTDKKALEATEVPVLSETIDAAIESTIPSEGPIQDTTQEENAQFYSVCTNYSKAEVELFAETVREMILAKDWESLSELVSYPVSMNGVLYEDRAAFLSAPFDTQLNADAIAVLEQESCADMFCNYAGIMMGNGEVWMAEVLNEDFSSAGLKVTGLHILNPTDSGYEN